MLPWRTLLVLLASQVGVRCLRLLEVHIPSHSVLQQSVRMECKFDLEGESLYSVKWYKDGREFYRYVPRDSPKAQLFALAGVAIDTDRSNPTEIILVNLTLSSSGRYRCEVSGEAPSFQTVSEHGDMLVIALPEEGPRISGGRPRYQIGDKVSLNCSSGRSKPAAHLVWFINGEQVDPSLVRGPETILSPEDDGLLTSVLGLEFEARPHHFRHGDLKLKCLASVATVYWRSNEESVQGDMRLQQQRARAMESRGTPATPRDQQLPVVPANVSSETRASTLSLLLLAATTFICR